jgi:hypothetical protein
MWLGQSQNRTELSLLGFRKQEKGSLPENMCSQDGSDAFFASNEKFLTRKLWGHCQSALVWSLRHLTPRCAKPLLRLHAMTVIEGAVSKLAQGNDSPRPDERANDQAQRIFGPVDFKLRAPIPSTSKGNPRDLSCLSKRWSRIFLADWGSRIFEGWNSLLPDKARLRSEKAMASRRQ